ncbi:MAG: hypothetical protein A3J48_00565 [Candidatus Doudnabacteria bacterium RIFCSPHIGHO2_02_FULL_46_11]|uniref:Uncharacterized protein n=1 Tax=Candidatus Doudnabacteria bacterium RIFCSPHIGHO2_02_FULL_46_11 TaxID=1817832 RepID=A0A1F5P566_9BACT|nr:MAG: hypothetical protein A3J48_00565 [Candidatus Doudnabacteria bacterium RIFCSPHIGHO2_02_FULL_46_11]
MSNFDASLRHEGPELCTRGDVIIALYFTSDWIEDAASVQKWLPHVADLAAAQHEGVCRGQAVVLNPRILYTRLGEDQNMAQFAGVESHELVMFVAKPMMMR